MWNLPTFLFKEEQEFDIYNNDIIIKKKILVFNTLLAYFIGLKNKMNSSFAILHENSWHLYLR